MNDIARNPRAVAARLMSAERAERAAELTSLCAEVSSTGKGFQAILWCNAIGESVVGKGPTVLTAVLDAHAKSNALKGQSDEPLPVNAQSVAHQAARAAFAVTPGASALTLNVQQLTTTIDSAIELMRIADEQFVGNAYAAGYGDGLGNYPSREADYRAAVSQSSGPGLNARRLEHYWRHCNALSHPSYFGFQEWLKQLDEDIVERTSERTKRPAADGTPRTLKEQAGIASELRLIREYIGERGAHREFQAVEFVEAYVEAAQEELRVANELLPPPGASPDSSTARYHWLRDRVSGAEYRRLGIIYSQIEEVDEQLDRILAAASPSKAEQR